MAKNETYEEFVGKFKPKKTTDDCYTPPLVYEAVKNWVVNEYGLQGVEIVRPFYPGGDYESYDYPKNCIVIDNPPFSILAKIKNFYVGNNIRFFLFAPALTLFSCNHNGVNYIVTESEITYENGAAVNTSFVTSEGDWFIRTAPELEKAVNEADKIERDARTAHLPKYVYPDNLVYCGNLKKISCVDFRLKREDCSPNLIRVLDSQRKSKKTIYGSGYLISDAKAAELETAKQKAAAERERKAAERERKWQLSERELAIIEQLNKSTANFSG